MTEQRPDNGSFEELASRPRRSAPGQIWDYLATHKKWWLAPLVITLVLLAGLFIAGATGAGPLIYTLF